MFRWTDYMSQCQWLFSQRITCKRDPNRMQNSLLILTSCLFISFNTQDVTFRCAAAVSRPDAWRLDVNKGLRYPNQNWRNALNLQPYSDIKYVGVFNFNVPAVKDPAFPMWKMTGHKGRSAGSGALVWVQIFIMWCMLKVKRVAQRFVTPSHWK